MNKDAAIYVAGHRGLVGSSILRALKKASYKNIITRRHGDLDLTDQSAVNNFFQDKRPEYVFLAAARVGGILANHTYPADFIYDNLAIETNVIRAALESGVKRLLFLGSSCIYPKFAEQPIKEEALLSGPLEPTNEPYAIAKIAGIKLCESFNRQYGTDFRSVMPTNLYGPGDNFHPTNSHVIPGLIRRFHEAKKEKNHEVVVWGTGKARREFLYVDDLADACLFVMNLDKKLYNEAIRPTCSHINVGTGEDITIRELAEMIAETVSFRGRIIFDTQKPDGTPRKLLDVSKIKKLGWRPLVSLREGLKITYAWYLQYILET